MSLISKIQKLRHMPIHEIAHRIKERAGQYSDRAKFELGKKSSYRFDDEISRFCDACRNLLPGCHLFDEYDVEKPAETSLEEFGDILLDESKFIRSKASELKSGIVELLGEPMKFRPASWSLDPTTDHQFEQTFHTKVVRHQHGKNAIDVKYPWELSQHQFLVPLAQAGMIDNDLEAMQLVRDSILDWIVENPLHSGVNWTSALEIAMRGISWIWCIACTGKWEGWSDDDLLLVRDSLADHAEYLFRNLSHYSSPYNHLVGESTGLYLLAKALESCTKASKWNERAIAALNSCVKHQFYDDGFTFEQTTSYHYFTLGFFALAKACSINTNDSKLMIDEPIMKAANVGLSFQAGEGCWAQIGDSDSARAIPVAYEDYWDFRGVASLLSALYPSVDSPRAVHPSETLWMLGLTGLKSLQQSPSASMADRRLLDHSGYAMMRGENGDWLCLDGGPVADGVFHDNTPSTVHGHLDVLQLLVSMNGKPILVDSGVPYYFKDERQLDHYRGPRSHNTISFDDFDLAENCGPLMWKRVAYQSSISNCKLVEGGWGALATLEVEGDASITIHRYVAWHESIGVVIADICPAKAVGQMHWHWHFDAGVDVKSLTSNRYQIDDDLMFCASAVGDTIEMVQTHDVNGDPVRYLAAGYGEKTLHPYLESRINVTPDNASSVMVVHAIVRPSANIVIQQERSSSPPIEIQAGESSQLTSVTRIEIPDAIG